MFADKYDYAKSIHRWNAAKDVHRAVREFTVWCAAAAGHIPQIPIQVTRVGDDALELESPAGRIYSKLWMTDHPSALVGRLVFYQEGHRPAVSPVALYAIQFDAGGEIWNDTHTRQWSRRSNLQTWDPSEYERLCGELLEAQIAQGNEIAQRHNEAVQGGWHDHVYVPIPRAGAARVVFSERPHSEQRPDHVFSLSEVPVLHGATSSPASERAWRRRLQANRAGDSAESLGSV